MQEDWFTEKVSEGSTFGIPGVFTTTRSYKVKEKLLDIQSEYQHIQIFDTSTLGKILVLDGIVMFTEKHEFTYHEMLAHVPIFSHSNPRQVLVVGGGDGGIVRECLKHDEIKTIDVCEIDKKIIECAQKFFPNMGSAFNDGRVTCYYEDATTLLKSLLEKPKRYDIIIADTTDPIGAASSIYGVEFTKVVQKLLNKGGIYACLGSCPFFEEVLIREMKKNHTDIFKHNDIYIGFVPFYQAGCWSFVMSSDELITRTPRRLPDEKFLKKCRYYNSNVHSASFCLPNFFEA